MIKNENENKSDNWMMLETTNTLLGYKKGVVDRELCAKLTIQKIEYGRTCIALLLSGISDSEENKAQYESLDKDLRVNITKLGGEPTTIVMPEHSSTKSSDRERAMEWWRSLIKDEKGKLNEKYKDKIIGGKIMTGRQIEEVWFGEEMNATSPDKLKID